MNTFSILIGALTAAIAIFATDQQLAMHGDSFITLGWPGMLLFLAIAGTTAWLGRIAILLLLVLAWRPRTALDWRAPSQCRSWHHWLSDSWDQPSTAGRQMGHRVFGLGLSLSGGFPAVVAIPERTSQSL